MTKRIALYIRVSASDGQQSVENQLRDLCLAGDRLGWEIVAQYANERINGANQSRIFSRKSILHLNILMPGALNSSLRKVLQGLNRMPLVRRQRERFQFIPVAKVETGDAVDFQQACAWAYPAEDGRSRNLQGRVLACPLFPEGDYVLWEFEIEDDAILFNLRFGGSLRGVMDVEEWRRDMFAQMRPFLSST